MLVAVVILFAVCWSPYLIDNVLTSFAYLPTTRTGPMKHMKMALQVFFFFSFLIKKKMAGIFWNFSKLKNGQHFFMLFYKFVSSVTCCRTSTAAATHSFTGSCLKTFGADSKRLSDCDRKVASLTFATAHVAVIAIQGGI